jgi:hypothetical protein
MTPTPAKALLGNGSPTEFGFTMQAAAGSVLPGKWWSVTSTCIPRALATATPSWLAMPLSTVTMRSGLRWRASSTTGGVRP